MKNDTSNSRKQRPFKAKAKIRATGATAPSGRPYVHIEACERRMWLPLALFQGSCATAKDLLAARNIILMSDWKKLVEMINVLDKFPPTRLIEHSGWSVRHFSLPDGTVFIGEAAKNDAVVLFEPRGDKLRRKGKLSDWLDHVAKPLADQHLATFVLMAMFAAPLLRLVHRQSNFGFELAGPKGVGKSTMQFIASSVMGPSMSTTGSNYWVSANATIAGLEGLMAEHDDLALVIEETNLFAAGESEKARAAKFNELVFRLADGSVKARHQDHGQKRYWFLYLTSTNEPLDRILAGERINVSEAAADRLLSLPIGPDRKFGVFDKVPEGYADASEYAASLNHAISLYHGTPIRRFLKHLVAAHVADARALRSTIDGYIAAFRRQVDIDANSGSATRVADAFGLVYAAGCLAKTYGALPAEMKAGRAAKAAYELNRSTVDNLSPKDRLLKLAKRKDIVRFEDGDLPNLPDEEVKAVPAFVVTKRNGRRTLLLTPGAMQRAFAYPKTILGDREVKAMLRHDKRRLTVKKRLSALCDPIWVYSFRLPSKDDKSLMRGHPGSREALDPPPALRAAPNPRGSD